MSSVYPFSIISGVYDFSAATSAGTAVQILPSPDNGQNYSNYLIQNKGAVPAYVLLTQTQAQCVIAVPVVGTPGNAIVIPAASSVVISGPPRAWFNAQTGSSTADLLIVGGEGTVSGLAAASIISGAGTVTGGESLGAGVPIFNAGSSSSSTLAFNSLVAGTNVTIIDNGDGTVTIDAAGGLLHLTQLFSNAAPNDVISVSGIAPIPGGSDTSNADLVLSPAGTGNILAQVPDGTTTGGNKRVGTNSIDLQMGRDDPSQVINGYNNFGVGYGNTIDESSDNCVVSGSGNNLSTSGSSSVSGQISTLTNLVSCHVSGSGTIAGNAAGSSLTGSSISGEYHQLVATENNANINFCTIDGVVAVVENTRIGASLIGQTDQSYANVFMLTGNQAGGAIITADATPTRIANEDSGLSSFNFKSAIKFKIKVVAFDDTFADSKEWEMTGLATVGATLASIVTIGSPAVVSTYATVGATSWLASLFVDTTAGAVYPIATGQAARNIAWSYSIETTEVKWPT